MTPPSPLMLCVGFSQNSLFCIGIKSGGRLFLVPFRRCTVFPFSFQAISNLMRSRCHGTGGGVHHHSYPHFLQLTFTGGFISSRVSKWTSSESHSGQVAWSVAAFRILVRSGDVFQGFQTKARNVTRKIMPIYTSLQYGLPRSASVKATEYDIIIFTLRSMFT